MATVFALPVLSGLVYAAGFPPLSWSIAAWLALAPLLVACAALSPLRAAVAGMCWAARWPSGVAWFLPGMLSHYFGLAAVPSWIAAVAIVGGLQRRLRERLRRLGGVAGATASGESASCWPADGSSASSPARTACSGSPWALTAYSQLRWTPLIQIADLAGPYGIGMLIAAVNAGAAAWLVPALRGRRPLLAAATIAAALVGALLYGQWRLGQTFGDGPAVRVAVVQGGAPPAEHAQRAARLARYVALTTAGAAPQTDLIVWPEYAVEAYLEEASPTRDAVLRLRRRDAGRPHPGRPALRAVGVGHALPQLGLPGARWPPGGALRQAPPRSVRRG